MAYLIFIVKTALEDFKRNKVRTLLTSLGILIGVASVVLLTALGLGLKKFISQQFESLGTNLLIVFPGKILGESGGFRPGGGALGGAEFDERDVRRLERIDNAEYVVPVFTKTVEVSWGSQSEFGDLFATSADMFVIRNLEAEEGVLFRNTDVAKRSKIVVIGPKISEKLFSSHADAIGKNIKIESQSFKIVGITKSKGGGGLGGPDFDSFIYMPYSAAISFNPSKTFFSLYVKAPNEKSIEPLKLAVEKTLVKRYDEGDFSVVEQTEILDAVTSIFAVLNNVLVLIGAISLVVGGIGIMNIMYVSVVERIKEIGIRRAIGATKRDILVQFLTESVLLSLIGGIGGILVSAVIVLLINQFFPAVISATSVLVAFGVSSLVGIVFGVFPARKAANMSPIEAIRYE